MTPFEVVYGGKPPTYTSYFSGESSVAVVNQAMKDRDSILRLLKENLHLAQNRMKKIVD